jgi:hypothetical protein
MLVLFCLINIWSSVYYILNYKRLDKSLNIREKNSRIDIIYFISKIIIIPILILIYLNGYKLISILNLSLILLGFITNLLNKKISNFIFKITPPLSIILMIYILYVELF